MGKLLRVVCWPCMLIGLVLILFGSNAVAQSAPSYTTSGPAWAQWFSILVGVLMTVTAGYVRGLSSRVDKLEIGSEERQRQLHSLRESIAREYHTKAELQSIVQTAIAIAVAPLSAQMSSAAGSVEAVHRRLDAMNVPRTAHGRSLFQRSPDDGN